VTRDEAYKAIMKRWGRPLTDQVPMQVLRELAAQAADVVSNPVSTEGDVMGKRLRIVANYEATGEIIEWSMGDEVSARARNERFGREILKRLYPDSIGDHHRVTLDLSFEEDA
jgi:hypothetical protein